MNLNMHEQKYRNLFAFVAVVMMYMSFGHNFFHAVNPDKFYTTGTTSDALVIGRLVESRQHGMLSEQARMGRFLDIDGDMNSNQVKLYLGRIEGGEYTPYDSQVGLQGMMFGIADSLFMQTGLSAETRLTIYHCMLALVFALVMTGFLVLMYDEIGLTASSLILLSIVFSRFQAPYAKSFYWMLPTMFLPMIVVLLACKFESAGKNINMLVVSLLVMMLVMLDSLMGYEFVTTIILSAVTPLVYFMMKDVWGYQRLVRRMFLIGTFALAGFVVALLLHIYQLELATGSFDEAIAIIKERILVRTYANPEDYAGTPYYKSQQASVLYVLFVYLLKGGTFRLKVPFLLWILMLVRITMKTWRNDTPVKGAKAKLVRALVVTSWFSLLAPLSWLVLAKSHSEVHIQINYIVWHLPFMLFVVALFGVYWEDQIRSVFSRRRFHASVPTSQ